MLVGRVALTPPGGWSHQRDVIAPPHTGTMSEHTATITMATSAAGSFSGPFIPSHVLFLGESSRPWWELHSLNECSAPVIRLVPNSPETILRDGLALIAAGVIGDSAAVTAFMSLGHSPGDGFIDLEHAEEGSFPDDMLRQALSSVHVAVTALPSSSIWREVELLRSVASDLTLFTPLED